MENTLAVGSVGFDLLFSLQPSFKSEIPLIEGRIDKINMTFVADDTKHKDGGTGSNVAYSHALLDPNVFLFSAVGFDFKDTMGQSLRNLGVKDRTVEFQRETARSLQITDSNGEQMIVWQPNAASHVDEIDLQDKLTQQEIESCKYAIFSPGTPISTLRHMGNFRKSNTSGDIIFDPGQMINHYSQEQFEKCLDYADMFILNDVEWLKVEHRFNLTNELLFEKFNVKHIIKTLGEKGSQIISKEGIVNVPPSKASRVIETTGAGDSFRGAMLATLIKGYNLEFSCKVAGVVSALSVQEEGPQLHKITWEEAKKKAEEL